MQSLIDHYSDENIALRMVTDADMLEVVELINHAFSYQDEIKGEKRITLDGLRKRLEKSEMYVWSKPGKIVACIYVTRAEDRLHFGLFSIADELRGGTLAGQIMASIEDYASALGLAIIELDYMSISDWLGRYYERYGYYKTGEEEDIGWSKLIRMEKKLNNKYAK